jgi:hypothetical protein
MANTEMMIRLAQWADELRTEITCIDVLKTDGADEAIIFVDLLGDVLHTIKLYRDKLDGV